MTGRESEARLWTGRVYSGLAGALLLWMYLEPPFVMAGALWREFLGGFWSFLALTLPLIAAAPLAAYFAAYTLSAAEPFETARWAAWPTAALLVYHGVMSALFKEQIAGYRDFGFAQFCNAGAWTGACAGFFGGFAYEPGRSDRAERVPILRRCLHAAIGAAGTALAWGFLGYFLEFSWRQLSGDPDMYLYFAVFLLLGTPFFCAGVSEALGSARPDLTGVWCVPPTFAALYVLLGGSEALVDPARADWIIGSLPAIGLIHGLVCGFLGGLGFRPRLREARR